MEYPHSTCWTVIRGAAERRDSALREFGRRYAAVLTAYFVARWHCPRDDERVQDAVQETFLEMLRHGGGLERFDPERPGGFRPFLYGIARNIAWRAEEQARVRKARQASRSIDFDRLPSDEESLALHFDRAWARAMLREARELLESRAVAGDARLREQLELLKLHFEEGLKIRAIAARKGLDEKAAYRAMERARQSFREALVEVVGFHHPGAPREAESEVKRLLAALE
jgi:RNA polymerase sigma-70 factor (ECF subfamily)